MCDNAYVAKLEFEGGCFDRDKLNELVVLLPRTYEELNALAPWLNGRWPTRVRCMTGREIFKARKRGAGHGYTYTQGADKNTIWLNPYMTAVGYWLVFVHENLHHAFPDATEAEINCVHLPNLYKKVFKERLDPDWARSQGIGSPVPGVGDRSYCR